MSKTAVITGVGGQDGWYLAELLLAKGYRVIGLTRTTAPVGVDTLYGDVCDPRTQQRLFVATPDEFYHLACLQDVEESKYRPSDYLAVNALAWSQLLQFGEIMSAKTRFFYPTSCVVADPAKAYASPYAASKLAGAAVSLNARQLGLYVAVGMMYNHESPRRRPKYVFAQLVDGVRGFLATGAPVKLRNIGTRVDWHHVSDAVRGMHLALQQPQPGDYTFASGETHSIREAAELVCDFYRVPFAEAIHYEQDVQEQRPPADVSTTAAQLGWTRRYSFTDMVLDICRNRETA